MKYTTIKQISLGLAGLISFTAQAQKTEMRYKEPVKLPTAINSAAHEESYPLLSKDGESFYFVRTYTEETNGHKKGAQNIFVSYYENGNWSLATDELPTLNNPFNNAVVGISGDGNRLYLLNQYPANPKQTAKGISLSLKDEEGNWKKPKTIVMPPINIKGDHYGAYVSRDERVIIFSANVEGEGEGDEDLYVALQNEEGRWMKIQHMGTTINTEKADFAPFLSADKKKLYFASFGHDGLGGSDIYVSERLDDSYTKWSEPENLGEPINSKGFDGYLAINAKNDIFFSSNSGKGFSDIYQTKLEEVVIEEPVDEEEEARKAIEELVSKFDLKLIYFKSDKADVQAEDAEVLDAVYDVMKQYDIINVIVEGHTDNTASEAYNLKLSEKRANAAAEFLVKKGLKRERIEVQFFGESKPVASNKNAEGRRQNRRVSLKLKIKK